MKIIGKLQRFKRQWAGYGWDGVAWWAWPLCISYCIFDTVGCLLGWHVEDDGKCMNCGQDLDCD